MMLLLLLFSCVGSLDKKDSAPCHYPDGPKDQTLQCDSSPQQIVFMNQESEQKRNLIIFAIDNTISESVYGFHPAIPKEFRHNADADPFRLFIDKPSGLALLFLYKPIKRTIVFRNLFLETLEYIRANISADLLLYTRERPYYAEQITLGIDELYEAKNGKISDGLLFS